jgi:hypothetical protein
VLRYTAGHINYGGRVTDDWDRRCLMNILGDFYCSDILDSGHFYSESGIYKQLDPETDHAVSNISCFLIETKITLMVDEIYKKCYVPKMTLLNAQQECPNLKSKFV